MISTVNIQSRVAGSQLTSTPSLAARRCRCTWSCSSSSWLGCQSRDRMRSMFRAYIVWEGITPWWTCIRQMIKKDIKQYRPLTVQWGQGGSTNVTSSVIRSKRMGPSTGQWKHYKIFDNNTHLSANNSKQIILTEKWGPRESVCLKNYKQSTNFSSILTTFINQTHVLDIIRA